MQYLILSFLLCTALRCPEAAETGVTQRMTLRGFAAKTDASALAMHLPDAFQVGSGAGGAVAPKAAYAPFRPVPINEPNTTTAAHPPPTSVFVFTIYDDNTSLWPVAVQPEVGDPVDQSGESLPQATSLTVTPQGEGDDRRSISDPHRSYLRGGTTAGKWRLNSLSRARSR